jgi:sulfite reductase beta subunit-like hemoprotein
MNRHHRHISPHLKCVGVMLRIRFAIRYDFPYVTAEHQQILVLAEIVTS